MKCSSKTSQHRISAIQCASLSFPVTLLFRPNYVHESLVPPTGSLRSICTIARNNLWLTVSRDHVIKDFPGKNVNTYSLSFYSLDPCARQCSNHVFIFKHCINSLKKSLNSKRFLAYISIKYSFLKAKFQTERILS